MRLLLFAALAAFALPASAQTVIEPGAGSSVVSGGRAGEAMRVTTYAAQPTPRGRLSRRYRGVSVNRSPRTIARFGPGAVVSGGVAYPVTATPQGNYVRKPYGSFRVVRGR